MNDPPLPIAGELAAPDRASQPGYLTPASDPLQGRALGNGEVGALVWCGESRPVLVVNRSDLWEDGPRGFFHNWALDEEEHSATLRHGGRFIVDFGLPVFDRVYVKDCRCELDLATATLSGRVVSAFGGTSR